MLDSRWELKKYYLHDENHSWYILGDVFFKMKNYLFAARCFRNALKAWPEDVDALMAVGNCYSELGEYRLSEKFLRKALKLNPDNLSVKFNLANAFFDQGEFDLALQECVSIVKRKGYLQNKAKKMIKIILTNSK